MATKLQNARVTRTPVCEDRTACDGSNLRIGQDICSKCRKAKEKKSKDRSKELKGQKYTDSIKFYGEDPKY